MIIVAGVLNCGSVTRSVLVPELRNSVSYLGHEYRNNKNKKYYTKEH